MPQTLFQSSLFASSFNGVDIYVTSFQHEGGRRVITHEFVMRDEPFVEDLGLASKNFSVTGYLVGDDVADQWRALEEACDTPGVGTFVHPILGSLSVALTQPVQFEGNQNRGRVISFTLHLVITTQSGTLNTTPFPQGIENTVTALESAATALQSGSISDFGNSMRQVLTTSREAVAGVQATVNSYVGYVRSAVGDVRRVFNSVQQVTSLAGPNSSLGRFMRSTSQSLTKIQVGITSVTTPAQNLVAGVNRALAGAVRAQTTITNGASRLMGLVNSL